jgi:hypothetical protein
MTRPAACRLGAVLVALAAALSSRGNADDKPAGAFQPLFNGKDFTGFHFFVKDGGDPAKTWSVKEGVIVCTGTPHGYFYTDKSYKDYVLRYDWRYPPGSPPDSNSGCLVHIHPPHKVWPQCIEPQGRYSDHGKLYMIGLDKAQVEYNRFDADAQKKALRPMGEWSTTEVTCKADGTITVKLNGVEVSSGKTALTEGPIGWQSEGAEVHFRNVQIREAKAASPGR